MSICAHLWPRLGLAVSLAWLAGESFPLCAAEPDALPGTELLVLQGDLSSRLVAGVDEFLLRKTEQSVAKRASHWKRDFSSADAYEQSIAPNRARLAHILGVRDARVPFDGFELVGTTAQPARVAQGSNYEVFAVRWPAFGDVHGEGLLLVPTGGTCVANVVAIPDCSQTPEQAVGLSPGVPSESQYARRLAECGCRVVVPMLINRQEKSPFPKITNREWVYRGAFEMGRGVIGYEIQKVLACVDWFAKQTAGEKGKIGVIGWSEGGLLALYAGALDTRIDAVGVSGYFSDRNSLWQEPLDRNLFGFLEQFGDAECASLIAPRTLVVEAAKSAEVTLEGGRGGPGRVVTPPLKTVRAEVDRAAALTKDLPNAAAKLVASGAEGAGPSGSDEALGHFLAALTDGRKELQSSAPAQTVAPLPDSAARQARQLAELDRHTQALWAESKYVRTDFFWKKLDYSSLEKYVASTEPLRKYFYDEIIGRFAEEPLPLGARTRKIEENDRWTRYEVVLDVFPEVIAYGLLTLPHDLKQGEQRPVVVCQHGLEGRPQDVIGEANYEIYKAFATKLAERGFITFAPQNLYLYKNRFRTLQRKANPLKRTLFSIITPQHQQILAWLATLPQVDAKKIAFYGISYGGKTAMRVPALLPQYSLSICSADFNEWIEKIVSTRSPYAYMGTGEYEIFEFDLGNTFNYAEMAGLIAPRPFMVERGHFDGVAVDEYVGYEYAKVNRLYSALLHIPNRTEIEWFVGPHAINEGRTYEFLHEQLNWPRKP